MAPGKCVRPSINKNTYVCGVSAAINQEPAEEMGDTPGAASSTGRYNTTDEKHENKK